MSVLKEAIKKIVRDVCQFAEYASGTKLRSYQREVAQAITDSVINHLGDTFVVVFPRQSGKNELQAQIEVYLLALFSGRPAEMVKISPTWKPQSLNAMRRLERVLKKNVLVGSSWSKESGYVFRVGEARIYFLSGSPTASIVGATASALLECDEAQDVQIEKWDKEVAPMAASTNATRVFWGTAWTSSTLLARELRAAREREKSDGVRRTWVLTADQVGVEVPAYRAFIQEEVRKHGRQHPFIRTQYYSEEIDDQSGMFPAERLALMRGEHAAEVEADGESIYAFLVDVAGEDEGQTGEGIGLENPSRDSTALTIVRLDLSKLNDPAIGKPVYRVVWRKLWTGDKHTAIYAELLALAEVWQTRYVVVDATGVGAGLASFLAKPLAGRVIPFEFTQKSKSDLGWAFLSILETGRYKEHAPVSARLNLQEEFWRQCEFTQLEVLPGPGKVMRWSVPDGTRDPSSGELLHDDLVVSAALCAVIDEQSWGSAESAIIHQPDILGKLSW
jgi:hypothetical protein